MTFSMPESYRAYCTDLAVRNAVSHILDKKRALSLPPDIDWADLPAFHRAVLSAQQVRCEFAIYLVSLWDTVWQPALDESSFASDLSRWTVAETENWCGTKFDTNTVWENTWFGRGFGIGDTNLQLGLAVYVLPDPPQRVKLCLSLWGADNTDHTTETDFGDDWTEKDEEGWANTGEHLVSIRDGEAIDLGSLHRAAADALIAIRNDIRG